MMCGCTRHHIQSNHLCLGSCPALKTRQLSDVVHSQIRSWHHMLHTHDLFSLVEVVWVHCDEVMPPLLQSGFYLAWEPSNSMGPVTLTGFCFWTHVGTVGRVVPLRSFGYDAHPHTHAVHICLKCLHTHMSLVGFMYQNQGPQMSLHGCKQAPKRRPPRPALELKRRLPGRARVTCSNQKRPCFIQNG